MCDDFGESEIGCVNVEVAFHYLEIGCDGAQELEGRAVGEVPQAEDLADLARY